MYSGIGTKAFWEITGQNKKLIKIKGIFVIFEKNNSVIIKFIEYNERKKTFCIKGVLTENKK